jgi:hypothetical protein
VITLEDWALIRRLAGEGVPKAQIAARLERTSTSEAVDGREHAHSQVNALEG